MACASTCAKLMLVPLLIVAAGLGLFTVIKPESPYHHGAILGAGAAVAMAVFCLVAMTCTWCRRRKLVKKIT